MVINVYVYLHDDLFLAMNPKIFVILGPATGYSHYRGDKAPYYRDDFKRGDTIYIYIVLFAMSHFSISFSP